MLRYIFSFLFALFFTASLAQTYTVSGQITSLENEEIGGVSVELLSDDNQLIESQLVNCGGTYFFSGLVAGQFYNLRLSKGGNFLNGTTTFDLVLIARHILGVDALDHPYKIRAADIDHSGHLSIMDMLLMRAWILSVNTDYPENNWLFFQAAAGTEGPLFPIVLMADQTNYNFTGIKLGDVNGSAAPCQ
jgi:hypothetical protein